MQHAIRSAGWCPILYIAVETVLFKLKLSQIIQAIILGNRTSPFFFGRPSILLFFVILFGLFTLNVLFLLLELLLFLTGVISLTGLFKMMLKLFIPM